MTLLTGYNGIFNFTDSNSMFFFKKTITNEEDLIPIRVSAGAYEIESLNKEIRSVIIDEGHFTGMVYPFKIKPNFSTLGSIIEISPQGPIISFASGDSMRNLLGFDETILYKEYNSSHNPVDIIPFDNIFHETDIAKGMISTGKRSGIIVNFRLSVSPG